MTSRTRALPFLSVALLGAMFSGCKDDAATPTVPPPTPQAARPADTDEASSATAPAPAAAESDSPAAAAPAPADPPAPPASAAAASPAGERQTVGEVSWELPAGWSDGGQKPMRLATLTDGQAEIAISAFPGEVGGIVANLDRWRGQVGLPPVASEAEAEKQFTQMDVAGRKVRMLDLKGQSRMLVATVPGDDKLYFFKMTGSDDVIGKRKDAFERFVQSIRVE